MSWRWAGRFVLLSRIPGIDPSLPLAEELLDAPVDRVLVGDLGERHVLLRPDGLAQILDELARAVRALHLPVAEQVYDGQDAVLQQLDAQARVVGAPVVAVREVERRDVPRRRTVLRVDD